MTILLSAFLISASLATAPVLGRSQLKVSRQVNPILSIFLNPREQVKHSPSFYLHSCHSYETGNSVLSEIESRPDAKACLIRSLTDVWWRDLPADSRQLKSCLPTDNLFTANTVVWRTHWHCRATWQALQHQYRYWKRSLAPRIFGQWNVENWLKSCSDEVIK